MGISLKPSRTLTRLFFNRKKVNESIINEYFQRLNTLRGKINPKIELNSSKEHYVKAEDGTMIFYQIWKPSIKNQPEFIFICQHGNNVNSNIFFPFADYFSDSLILGIDNRGHGRSGPKHGDNNKFELQLKIFDFFIEKYHALYPSVPIFLIGESLGSALILHYLSRDFQGENCLSGVILMVPPLKLSITYKIKKIKGLYKILLFFLSFLDRISNHKVIIKWPQDYDNPTYLDEFNEFDKFDLLKHNKVSFRNIKTLLQILIPLESLLSRINTAMLILQGTGDKILDPIGAKMLFDEIKSMNKKLVYFNDANHSLFMDKNSQEIYKVISTWTRQFI